MHMHGQDDGCTDYLELLELRARQVLGKVQDIFVYESRSSINGDHGQSENSIYKIQTV